MAIARHNSTHDTRQAGESHFEHNLEGYFENIASQGFQNNLFFSFVIARTTSFSGINSAK